MEWISIKDKLPEYTKRARGENFACVLICLMGEAVGEGMYIDGRWEYLGVKTDIVTHWMPLPDPPKDSL